MAPNFYTNFLRKKKKPNNYQCPNPNASENQNFPNKFFFFCNTHTIQRKKYFFFFTPLHTGSA